MVLIQHKSAEAPATQSSGREPFVSPHKGQNDKKMTRFVVGAVYVVLIILGIGTGYLLSTNGKLIGGGGNASTAGNIDKGTGSTDMKIFKDSAEGTLEKGGINGEGTHKLIREGGESQTAYLVSSSVDLDVYVGKKVKVWGETFAAKKAAWLMDVGKVEVLK